MTQIVTINPIYSQVVICAPDRRVEVPVWQNGFAVVSTSTCILCLCYPEQDGTTEVWLGRGDQSLPDQSLKFDGRLKTPGGVIAIETVEEDPVMSLETGATEVRVRIWMNHDKWPNKVSIGID